MITIAAYPEIMSVLSRYLYSPAGFAAVAEPVLYQKENGVKLCIQAIRRLIRTEYEDFLSDCSQRLERLGLELNEDGLIRLVSESLGAPEIALEIHIRLKSIFETAEQYKKRNTALQYLLENIEELLEEYSEKLECLLERAQRELYWGIEYQTGIDVSGYLYGYDLQYDIAA